MTTIAVAMMTMDECKLNIPAPLGVGDEVDGADVGAIEGASLKSTSSPPQAPSLNIVGLEVGTVGFGVGLLVVGSGVGLGVGRGVGLGTGGMVGLDVGLLVGKGVGSGVGLGVGFFVGLGIGGIVGLGVGLFVGLGVGRGGNLQDV